MESALVSPSIQVCSQYILIYLILGLAATFTPATSRLHPAATATILALATSIQITAQNSTALPFYLQMTAGLGAWTQFFNSLDILIHRRISYAEHMRWKRVSADADADVHFSSRDAVCFTLWLPFNFRRIGTKWQVTPIYAFKGRTSGAGARVLRIVPSRVQFIQERVRSVLTDLCATALVYCVCSWLAGSWRGRRRRPGTTELCAILDYTSLSPLDVPWHSLHALLPISVLLIAAIFTTEKLAYDILSIAAVSLRMSDPVDWPPFQASLREAWTVRRFWGRFWHQAFRSFLTSNADYVMATIARARLALPPSLSCGTNKATRSTTSVTSPTSITSRYARYTLCFLISGTIHHLFDLGMQIPRTDTGALKVFLLQPLAFAAEDIAAYFSTRYSILARDTDTDIAVRRGIGYLWVVGFSAWTWRAWTFPMLERALGVREPVSSGYFAWMGCGSGVDLA
ncbi:membrane bound O-acyl transferase family-domain-containing protein [Aspergillus carlsbadensis]|nr:membrane bound O-acyl transferase family-domain-containing protein [Aspergillus carlsbadensis]